MEPWSGLLEATVRIAVPILFAVLGEIVAERAGVLNVGLEGMMLAGAFGAFALAWVVQSPAAGLAGGIAAASLLAACFALCVIRLAWDPIVTGVALNVLSLGVTGVLFRALTSGASGSLAVPTWPVRPVPGLADLPLVGPALFAQNALGYAAFALAALCAIFLSRTTPGLVLRAAGENPEAVETAGVDVRIVRLLATLFGGACAGAAGAYLATGYSNTFVEGMSAGRGFVALAIVVFARWRPSTGLLGALLFGLAMSLQVRLQGRPVLGAEIPYQFFQALPYLLTLVVLARSARPGAGAPAALGRPFRRER
jgi:simple sugar transport system permease protein